MSEQESLPCNEFELLVQEIEPKGVVEEEKRGLTFLRVHSTGSQQPALCLRRLSFSLLLLNSIDMSAAPVTNDAASRIREPRKVGKAVQDAIARGAPNIDLVSTRSTGKMPSTNSWPSTPLAGPPSQPYRPVSPASPSWFGSC